MAVVVSPLLKDVKLAGEVARNAELHSVNLKQVIAKFDPLRPIGAAVAKGEGQRIALKITTRSARPKFSGRILSVDVSFEAEAKSSVATSPVAKWTIVIQAKYVLSQGFKPAKTAAKAFASTNAMLNCWPYWRLLADTLTHWAGYPRLQLPLLHIAPAGKARKRQ